MREAVMVEVTAIYLPSPPVGEGGAERSSATGEGFLRLGELCENVLQYGGRLLQYLVVPVARDPKAFGLQGGISRSVALGFSMLTTIDFDDELPFEAHEIENEVLKGDLSPKLEEREPSTAEQPPHGGFGVGRLTAQLFCETADALGGWTMVWRLRYEPLTRRLTS
jgi:hypothetical protein